MPQNAAPEEDQRMNESTLKTPLVMSVSMNKRRSVLYGNALLDYNKRHREENRSSRNVVYQTKC